jgi:hypothetical protein
LVPSVSEDLQLGGGRPAANSVTSAGPLWGDLLMSKALLEPILDGGISTVNFFNGRLLSAEDLTVEQAANREAQRRIGLASGEGIAFGLEVSTAKDSTADAPVLAVNPGLAVTRSGYTLGFSQETNVSLVRPAAGSTSGGQIGFEACRPVQTGVFVSGEGGYLLTLAPVSGRQGLAPVSGLGNGAATCNSNYIVEGVQFRLIPVDVPPDILSADGPLRNKLAYGCFGVTQSNTYIVDPLGQVASGYGLLDALRPGVLTDCDVPLAIIVWTAADGIKFVDNWSVRRRRTSVAPTPRWEYFIGDRTLAEAEARFLQFQEHIDAITKEGTGAISFNATDRFDFLPPVGVIPIAGDASAGWIDWGSFFGGRGSNDVAALDASVLRPLLNDSFYHEPINLALLDSFHGRQKIQLYIIWENLNAMLGGFTTELSMVFASRTLPYRGTARFGPAQWNFGRFASSVI